MIWSRDKWFTIVGAETTKNTRVKWQARKRGGGGGLRGSNEPPFQLNDGALKTQVVDFQLFFSGGMENELWVF